MAVSYPPITSHHLDITTEEEEEEDTTPNPMIMKDEDIDSDSMDYKHVKHKQPVIVEHVASKQSNRTHSPSPNGGLSASNQN